MITLEKNLATRQSAQVLFRKMKREKDYSLDFRNVIFASRSFTNELVNLEKKYEIEAEKKNMKEDVMKMFEIADKPLNMNVLRDEKYSTVPIDKYLRLLNRENPLKKKAFSRKNSDRNCKKDRTKETSGRRAAKRSN